MTVPELFDEICDLADMLEAAGLLRPGAEFEEFEAALARLDDMKTLEVPS